MDKILSRKLALAKADFKEKQSIFTNLDYHERNWVDNLVARFYPYHYRFVSFIRRCFAKIGVR